MGGGEDGEDIRLTGVLVEDFGNGKYLVTYAARHEGKYRVNVEFNGTYGGKAGPLRGSGNEIDFSAKALRENNQMSGDLVINALRADIVYLQQFVDDLAKTILVRMKDDSWSRYVYTLYHTTPHYTTTIPQLYTHYTTLYHNYTHTIPQLYHNYTHTIPQLYTHYTTTIPRLYTHYR